MAGRAPYVPTKETRAKIAATLRGRTLSDAHKAKVSAGLKRAIRNPLAGIHISAALKGKPKSQSHRAALSAANTGKRLTESARLAMRSSWAAKSYEERLAVSAPGRAAANPGSHRGEHNKRWWNALDEASRQRIVTARAAKLSAQWANLPESEREARKARLRVIGMDGTRAARMAKPTTIERAVALVLDALDIAYRSEHRIGSYIVDFLITDRMLVIECDGSYWHAKPNVRERDIVRDRWLEEQGYRVIRLRESDIRSGAATAQIKAVVA